MANKITYPLTFALALSPSAGAVYEGVKGRLTIHTLEGWFITVELHQESVCEEFQDYEDCSWYLARNRIPEDKGWIPEPLTFVPEEEGGLGLL